MDVERRDHVAARGGDEERSSVAQLRYRSDLGDLQEDPRARLALLFSSRERERERMRRGTRVDRDARRDEGERHTHAGAFGGNRYAIAAGRVAAYESGGHVEEVIVRCRRPEALPDRRGGRRSRDAIWSRDASLRACVDVSENGPAHDHCGERERERGRRTCNLYRHHKNLALHSPEKRRKKESSLLPVRQ